MGQGTADLVHDERTPPVVIWPVDRLIRHPQNRVVNTHTERFAELLASVKLVGVIEPLTVRETPEVGMLQILSGERRYMAAVQAGRPTVPVRNFGAVPDDVAYRIVVVGNLHEDLTPLEEGQRAAALLDHYRQDAAAVASLLGKTASWVVQHAQIARGLSAEWQKEIAEAMEDDGRPKWRQWTAGHLAVIARLPVSLQAHWLDKVRKDYRFHNWPHRTIRQIEDDVKLDLLYLAKAPFNVETCAGCVDRTDRQPLLWGETVEAATGDKARCLNKKCWDKKVAKAAREDFEQRRIAVIQKYNITGDQKRAGIVPLSLAVEPESRYANPARWEAFREAQSALKRTFPHLATRDRVEIVEEGAKNAVPAIVVAGKSKGSVKWVRIKEKAKPSASALGNSPARPPRNKKELQLERWQKACVEAWRQIEQAARIADEKILACCVYAGVYPGWNVGEQKARQKMQAAYAADPSRDALIGAYVELCWEEWLAWVKAEQAYCWGAEDRDILVLVGPFFEVDVQKIYNDLAAKEKAVGETQPAGDSGDAACDGNPTVNRKKRRTKKGKKADGDCDSDCQNCSQPNCNGRQVEFDNALDLPDGDLPEDDSEELGPDEAFSEDTQE